MSGRLLALTCTAVEAEKKIIYLDMTCQLRLRIPGKRVSWLMTTGANCDAKSFMTKRMDDVDAEEPSGKGLGLQTISDKLASFALSAMH